MATGGMLTDWMIPTYLQIKTLIDYNKSPASVISRMQPVRYWTATNSNCVYGAKIVIDFSTGMMDHAAPGERCAIICVREGKNGLEWSYPVKGVYDLQYIWRAARELKSPVYDLKKG